MKRLFVFGCSFTSYSWPGWSDLLSVDFDIFENWGLAGIGNRGIAERIAECNIKHTFQPGDTVIVQWSTHLRNDFFHQSGTLEERLPGWKTAGSIFNYLNTPIYDENWCKTFFDEEAYFMHTLNFITMTQYLLESTGVNWYMTSIGDVRNLGTDVENKFEYGERSIFTELKEKFLGTPKYFGYNITPSLEIYDDIIWGKHADRWIAPIWNYLTSKKLDSHFYQFADETGRMFEDQHFRTSAQAEWLSELLLPKLNLKPNLVKYKEIIDTVDSMYYSTPDKERLQREFEKRLFHTKFNLPKWPNMIKGFYYF